MKNRNIWLLASLLLSVPTGYLCAAAESAEALALRLAAEEGIDQRVIAASIAASLDDDESGEKENKEAADLVVASAIDMPIDLQKRFLKSPSRFIDVNWPVTKRGNSIVQMIVGCTPLNDEFAVLIENYEKYTMVGQIINTDGAVDSIAIAPNGKSIAAAIGKNIIIYNAENGILLKTFTCESIVMSVAISPDGQYIASGSWDKTVRIWNIETGECLQVLDDHQGWVTSVAFSFDGQYIVSGSQDLVRIWDVETGQCLYVLEGDQSVVQSVAFSPDGQQIVLGSSDGICILNVETDQCIRTLEGHRNIVRGVAFSPNGKYIASGSTDGTVRIWNAENGQCLHVLEGHQGAVMSVAFSPNGKYVVFGSRDQTIGIGNVETGEYLYVLEGRQGAVASVAFSPDGGHIVYGAFGKAICIWDISNIINN